jgi:hypothetical protein
MGGTAVSDVLTRSNVASKHRDEINALLQADELIYNAVDATAERLGARTVIVGAVIVTSSRLLMVSTGRRGRINVKELGWSEVARSGTGRAPGRPNCVLLQERVLRWAIETRDDHPDLLAATIQEARDAYAEATTAKRSAGLTDGMQDLRKQRGF